MHFIRRSCLAAAIVASLALGACKPSTESARPVTLDAAASERAAAAIAQPAWLRDRLPEHTVAYARIPTLWGLAAAPNGRALDGALASQAHTQVIATLRANLANDQTLRDTGMLPALLLVLDDLAAPLEMAVVDGSDIANPASNVLLSAQLKFADVAALNARLAELKVPLLKAPLDASGKGQLTDNGFVQFDPATRRLHALFGMAASAFALDSLVKQTAQTRTHALQAMEQDIDRSGQGLFYWMSLKGVNGMAASKLESAKPGTVTRDFIDKSQSIALGWGTAGTRGKLQMQLNAPGARLLGYFAPTTLKAGVKTAGKPIWAMSMAIPTTAQLTALEANLNQDFGASSALAYSSLKNKAQTELGVDPVQLLGLLGGGVVGFEDAAGTYSAFHVTDTKALYAQIDTIAAKLKWTHETVKSGSATVHHLHIPGMKAAPKTDVSSDPSAAWIELFTRMGSHLYWVEEGEYLVFGQIPQALADRAQATLDTDLGEWLRQSQSYDPSATLVGMTAVTQNAQRKVYYAYLGGLQAFADLLGQRIDLAALPNAASLNLPVQGATGMALEATPDRVGFSITYEQNPAEILFSGGSSVGAVAVAGILAAIAVPAYNEYTVRAEVSQVLDDAAPLTSAISEHYTSQGELPASDEELTLPEFGPALKYLTGYYVDQGALVLQFGDEADSALRDHTLVLKPYLQGDVLSWQCGDGAIAADATALSQTEATSSVPAKLLPARCK